MPASPDPAAPEKAADPRKYLDPRFLSRISRLEVKARLIVEGFISGLHRSPYHGFSVEFAEHREYVPGDDIRHIDWKVFGRSDRFYIKQYEEETNLKAYLLLDASESMAYPDPPDARKRTSERPSKFEYASYVAAGLAYLLMRQQDSVGLGIFDDRLETFLQPSSNPSHLQLLLGAIEGAKLRSKTNPGAVFHEIAERLQKRSLVVILSDLFGDMEGIRRGLKHLRHRGHEVILFHVLDHDELAFPFQRMTLFEGLEGMPELLASPRTLRDGYLRELEEFLAEVRKACQDSAIDYVQLDTQEPLDVALTAYLARRSASRRT